MTSKRERYANKILDALRDPAPLNNNPGPLIKEFTRSHSKKDRKRGGHVTPSIICPQMKWNDIKQSALLPQIFWDDWMDHRDGMRFGTFELDKFICPEKLEKQKNIRKARKQKQKDLNTSEVL